MTAFLSTYLNRVDRKGRVSVPAAYRTALAGSSYQGILAYPSLVQPAIEAFGREMLDTMNQHRFTRSLDGGALEEMLVGDGDDMVEFIMGEVKELPFDGEGRVVLPAALAAHAGITDRATFVGRGSSFQIWAPEVLEPRLDERRTRLRERLSQRGRT